MSIQQTDLPARGPAAQLAERAARLRTRSGPVSLDRWLLTVGGLLLPLGLFVILLGWMGAAHTALVFEQVPYLLSGGLLGLGLVIIGGFVYFAYWQSLLVRESREYYERTREHDAQLLAALGRIESALREETEPTTDNRMRTAASRRRRSRSGSE
jgi:hypothetical protein